MHVPSELALIASVSELHTRIQDTGPLCSCRIPSSLWYVGLTSHTLTCIQTQRGRQQCTWAWAVMHFTGTFRVWEWAKEALLNLISSGSVSTAAPYWLLFLTAQHKWEIGWGSMNTGLHRWIALRMEGADSGSGTVNVAVVAVVPQLNWTMCTLFSIWIHLVHVFTASVRPNLCVAAAVFRQQLASAYS
jgi:hypothetical protein